MTNDPATAGFAGSIPENYHKLLGPLLFEITGEDTARRICAPLLASARILEIACGTGISTKHIAAAMPPGSELIATDLSADMLSMAQKANGTLPGVRYQEANALDLPFEDDSFDAVVCQFGIMFFPDKTKGMLEIARVLKPEGTALVSVWDSVKANTPVEVAIDVLNNAFDQDPRCSYKHLSVFTKTMWPTNSSRPPASLNSSPARSPACQPRTI